MSAPRRVSASQLKTIRSRLSDRDHAVLGSIRSFRLITNDQLRRIHFNDHASLDTSKRICRRTLQRLHSLGLVRRLERRIGGIRAGSAGYINAATPLGHRVLGTAARRRWREPSAGFVDHTLAIAELGSMALRLSLNAGHELLAFEPEPEAWRHFHDGLSQQVLKPDLALRIADEHIERSWFVEVDLGTESRSVIERKCGVYTKYWRTGIEQAKRDVFPRVLWVAPDSARAKSIASTFTRRGIESRLFDTATADHAADVLTDLHHQLN